MGIGKKKIKIQNGDGVWNGEETEIKNKKIKKNIIVEAGVVQKARDS